MTFGQNVRFVTMIKTDMKEKIDMTRVPQHIAIIMDGNGRWANERDKERSVGHQAGVETEIGRAHV